MPQRVLQTLTMSDAPKPDPENPQALPESAEGMPQLRKIISFDTLTRCGDEVWIEHKGQLYRLSKTRQDKLILTK